MEDTGMSPFFLCKLEECLTLLVCLYNFCKSLIHQHGIQFALLTTNKFFAMRSDLWVERFELFLCHCLFSLSVQPLSP